MTRTLSSLALLLAIALGIAPSPPSSNLSSFGPSAPAYATVTVATANDCAARCADASGWTIPPARPYSVSTPTGSVGTALLGGFATFYSDPSQRIDHYAAAGPLLRDALGHWRGKVIRVTSGQHSTIVRLADFCACGRRHGLPTLLDLSPEAFRDLAPLSAGIVRVSVELVSLPATDALPRNAADLRMMLEVRDDAAYR